MDNKTYEYRLTYMDGDKECTHVFSAYIDVQQLKSNLRQFLLATGWSEEQVDNILGKEHDE